MSEKSVLVQDLAQLLAGDEGYSAQPWQSLVMVGEVVPGRTSMNGFVYLDNGQAVPASPRSMQALKKLKEVSAAMQAESGKRWLACVVRIDRPSGKVDIHFEYDDAERWLITPQNVAGMAETLRPAA